MRQLAVGILAHVDSGKTTLSEALLFAAGAIKKRGRVDHKDAFLDTAAPERSRGITIFSKTARFSFADTVFTLLDTPGHVDFSAETERTLQVLDYAVLVICATDGVQSHTRTLWRLLQKYAVPCFVFVNKTDLPGADYAKVLRQLKEALSPACVDFTHAGTPAFFEDAALCDEALLEIYEETGALPRAEIAEAVRRRLVFPCFSGSALQYTGVEVFLRGLDDYAATPRYSDAFAARVYKIAEDKTGGRLTFLKITGGTLSVRDVPANEKNVNKEKVGAIRLYSGEKYVAAERAEAGTVCAVTGLSFTAPGDGLGAAADGALPVLEPVLAYTVRLPEGTDAHTAMGYFRQLETEDPLLHVEWEARAGEIRVRLMGEVQREVLAGVLADRFGLTVTFERGSIVYKETVKNTVEGVGHFEPLRHYAEVHLLIKPGAPGSGVRIRSDCREDTLDKNWQRLILTHLAEKTHVGVLTGAPLTDVELVLVSGRAHNKHTEGGDFRQATYRAVRQGLRTAENVLLEPVYAFTLEIPPENLGRALTDLDRLHANARPPETVGEFAVVTGTAPVASLWDYEQTVRAYTRGLGRLSCSLQGYAPCHNAEEIIAQTGYDPDADTENSCDSVFCSHGAGHTVKWNEVPQYMHLPSALAPPRRETASSAAVPAKRTAGKPDVFALDKELMQIFAQTYGPIKNRSDPYDVYKTYRTAGEKKPKEPKTPVTYAGPEYLLVDGYNVIHAWDALRVRAEENLADAREDLIRLLCNYQGYRQCAVILVFDAYRVKGALREVETVGGVSVVYTKEAETADTYIEITSHELAKNNRVRVVTSDGMEQIIILGNGALRVSADAFYEEVLAVQREIRERMEQN